MIEVVACGARPPEGEGGIPGATPDRPDLRQERHDRLDFVFDDFRTRFTPGRRVPIVLPCKFVKVVRCFPNQSLVTTEHWHDSQM